MATLDSVQNPGISEEVDVSFHAGRVSIRPLEYQTLQGKILGHYRIFGQTSAIAPAAAGIMGLFRWADPTNFAVIMRLSTCVTVVTAVTAQRTDPMIASIARAYTAVDGTNATALTISGQNQKVRSTMGSSVVTNISVASAAAGATGGTKTVDANPIGFAAFGAAAIAALGTGMPNTQLYAWDQLGEHPIILAQQEGVLLQWGTTTLATGTVTVGWGVEWAEVAAF